MTTDHDDLRARLARLDPMPLSAPVDPFTSPRAQELLERAMQTIEPTLAKADSPRWRRPAILAAAAATVVAVGVGAVVAKGGDSSKPSPARAKTTLALSSGSSGGLSLGSCIPFSTDLLKGVPVAFGGTVTSISAGSVSIDVDHWFKGGSADVVTVATPPDNTSVGPVEFAKGKRYLVTATEGTVNSCGLTGEATPDLQKSFDEAFAP